MKRRTVIIAVLVAAVLAVWLFVRRRALSVDAKLSVVSSGPLDIRLTGVRPDNSYDLLDTKGKKIGTATLSMRGNNTWNSDSFRRDFIFELPSAAEPPLFLNRRLIKVAGKDIRLHQSSMNPLYPERVAGRTYVILDTHIPRTYSRSVLGLVVSRRKVEKVDVTLEYFLGPRGKSKFSFTGPLKMGRTASADNNSNFKLKVGEYKGSGMYGAPGLMFHLETTEQIDISTPIVIYDNSGNRHLTWVRGWSSGSRRSSVSFCPLVISIPLADIKAIVAEEPYRYTVKNIRIDYSDRPQRNYSEYLDVMAQRLNLIGMSPEKLSGYQFKNPQEAIEVIDIIQGDWHARQAVEAIRYSKPRLMISELDEQTQQRIRRTAKEWTNWGYRSHYGIELGLLGQWPEFFDMAIERLNCDYPACPDYPGHERAMINADRDIADIMSRRFRQLDADQVQKLKEAILKSSDGPVLRCLFTCLGATKSQDVIDAVWQLAHDDRPWIWWQAIRVWHQQMYKVPGHYDNAPEKIKLRLILAQQERDDEQMEAKAYAMLPDLFTSELAKMDSSAWSDVRERIARHLDKKTATEIFVKFLRQLQKDMTQQQWATNDIYKNRSKWMVAYVIRTLNVWYGVNIGNLGTEETSESHKTEPRTLSEFNQLISKALQWYDSNENLQPVELSFVGRVVDTAGKPISQALLSFTKLEDYKTERGSRSQRRVNVGQCRTGADGKYEFKGFTNHRSYDFDVTAGGFAPRNGLTAVRLTDGRYRYRPNNVIELHRPGKIEGMVLDADGAPFANAELELFLNNRYSEPDRKREIKTDAEGKFSLENISKGNHLLSYTKYSYVKEGNRTRREYGNRCCAVVLKTEEGEQLTDVVLDLSKSLCTLELQLVAESNEPVRAVTLYFDVEMPPGGSYKYPTIFLSKESDPQGVYRLKGMPPGKWRVRVSHRELGQQEINVDLVPGKITRHKLTFESAPDSTNPR